MNAHSSSKRAVSCGAAALFTVSFVQAAFAQDPTADAAATTTAPTVEAAAPSPETGSVAASASVEGATTDASASVAAPPPSTEAGSAAESTSGGGLFESSVASSDSGSSASGSGLEIGGFVRGATFIGKTRGKNQSELRAGYGELALQLRTPKESYGDAFGDVRFRYGTEDGQRVSAIDLHEAYVNAYMGPLDLRLGQQIIVWGRSDAFSPTNNLTAMDLRVRSPQEDDKRMGNLAARAFLNFSPIRIEGVWLPIYKAVEFPPVELPRPVIFGENVYPAQKLGNGTLAGRIHLELAAFEMSVSYLKGYSSLPGLAYNHAVINGELDDNDIVISRVAYRHQVFGFDFATTLGDVVGLRAEAAYRVPQGWETHVNVPHPDVQYVLGLDKTFGGLNVIAQYMGRYVFDWKLRVNDKNDTKLFLDQKDPTKFDSRTNFYDEALVQRVSDGVNRELAVRNQGLFQQLAEIQHLAALRLELLTLHETLSFSALGMMNFTTMEWLAFPKIAYKFTDHLTGTVGAEIYNGKEDTLLDLIEPTLNAGYAELRVGF